MDKNKTRVAFVGAGVVLALAFTLLSVSLTSAAVNAVTVSGQAALPGGGLPVPDGTWAWLLNPDQTIHAQSQVVTATGDFSFAGVTPGAYLVRVVPPANDLTYAPSNIWPVHVLTTPVSLPGALELTTPSVTGTVYAPDGITPVDARVQVYAGPLLVEDRPTVAGDFALGGLPAGTYALIAEPLPDDAYWHSHVTAVTLNPSTTQYVSLTLQPAGIAGVVLDGLNPVEDARVYAVTTGGLRPSDVTGPQGRFAIGDLPIGVTATLLVAPPPDRGGLFPPAPQVVIVPDLNVTLTFRTSRKIVSGWVRTNTLTPILNASVEAHRVDALGQASTWADASGAYSLTLSPGVWAVDVHPVSGTTVPDHWVYPYPPRLVQFDDTLAPEHKLMNFNVLTADATVEGAVELPGGGSPPFTVTVSLHTDEGIGRSQLLDSSGQYSIQVPHGVYKMDLRVGSQLYAAPPLLPIYARPLTPTHVPTITLLARDAYITGTLLDEGSNPVADVPVIAWNPDTHATFGARSGPDGIYDMAVYSDTWLVRPAPAPDQPYIYNGDPTSVDALSGQVTGDVNFTLTAANATLHGVLVDADGMPVTSAQGWATAVKDDLSLHNGAPVDGGEFNILVPDGSYTVTLNLPGVQPYMYDGQSQVASATSGVTTNVTFTLIEKTARIRGVTYDKRTDLSVDVDGRVFAWDNGLWTGTDLKPGGYYTLPVPAGLWTVNYAIDPESNYLKTAGPRSYGIQDGQTQDVPLPLVRKDGLLTGTVVLTDGVTPAAGAMIIAEGVSPDLDGITLRAPVQGDGSFALRLPSGLYHVRASRTPQPLVIDPAVRTVFIPRNGSNNVTLQYRQANALIVGTVTLASGGPIAAPVQIWGWSDDGGYNTTIATVGGAYALPVVSGRPWHIVAVLETPNQYWITRTLVPVTSPIVGKNLVLEGPHLKPAPVTVMFDPSEDRLIELSDGTRIFIPAGAIPAAGRVILHITPLAGAPHQRNGDVLGLTYAFEAYTEDGQPITDNFNQDVIISFKYDPAAVIAMGLNVDRLRPAYFSTTTNSWTLPDSYVVDENRHIITMQIDHFTRFGILSLEGSNQIFLPIVLK